jgi:hypothetical protein
VTTGHNALRGSGPGQKHVFEDAVAHVGCPDRRIDRRCITRCSPSQPLPHTGMSRRETSHFLSAVVAVGRGLVNAKKFVSLVPLPILGSATGAKARCDVG